MFFCNIYSDVYLFTYLFIYLFRGSGQSPLTGSQRNLRDDGGQERVRLLHYNNLHCWLSKNWFTQPVIYLVSFA